MSPRKQPVHREKSRIGIAWYLRHQWGRLLEISEDRADLEETFEEWEERARERFKELRTEGYSVEKVVVDVDALLEWCGRKRIGVDARSRSNYVVEKLRTGDTENLALLARLAKKLRRKTSILTDDEVEVAAHHVRRLLGEVVGSELDFSSNRTEDTVRWSSLRARCEQERQKRKLGFKEISSQLKIPQYRLRSVEDGRLGEFNPDIAHEYFKFLGIEPWVKRWARANGDLAKRTGIIPFPGSRRKRPS
jgi:hypothetical protein